MSFGLARAPTTFLGVMNDTLQPVLQNCVLMFFYNILVYSKNMQEHEECLPQVLALLHRDQWKVKHNKFAFGQQQIAYLGHVMSVEGIAIDPNKIKAVEAWPTPRDVKDICCFLGLRDTTAVLCDNLAPLFGNVSTFSRKERHLCGPITLSRAFKC